MRRPHPHAWSGQWAAAADRSRTGDRDVDRCGPVQPRGRRATDDLGAHRRTPHLQRDGQDRYGWPRRPRGAAAAAPASPRIVLGWASSPRRWLMSSPPAVTLSYNDFPSRGYRRLNWSTTAALSSHTFSRL